MSKESKPLEEQRFRKFSCVTYLSETQLQECLQRAGDMIRGFAYCYLDMLCKHLGAYDNKVEIAEAVKVIIDV